MKIVVLNGYVLNPGDLKWDNLKALGDVIIYEHTSLTDEEEIISHINDAEIVFTSMSPIKAKALNECPNIKFICTLHTGYDNIDIDLAKEKGILVANSPNYGSEAVAQHAIALLLEITNQVGHHNMAVHKGRWESTNEWSFWDFPLVELNSKTIGIIGFGRIGQKTGMIAKAIGMKVIANDYVQNDSGREIGAYVELDELLRSSDIIALHCPLLPSTTGIINRNNIAKMKDGVIIINNSRGQLVVEQDLADALNSGKVLAAGLDVVSSEPIKKDNPLLKAKNCFITPHISWAPRESRERLLDIAINNLVKYIEGTPVNLVNS